MSVMTTAREGVTTLATTTRDLAFTPQQIPGVSKLLNLLGGWVTGAVYTVCIIAFLLAAGYIAWDRISDRGNGKGMGIAIAALVGTVLASSATAILDQVRQSTGA